MTILLMRGKVNFRNLSRYSDYCEKTYARHYQRTFAFVEFNERLLQNLVPAGHELMGVMDCSFIPKSGKETYGLGYFYNSSQDKATKGLEISVLGVVDVTDNTAYTLSARQTPPQVEIEELVADQSVTTDNDEISRVDFYAWHLRQDIQTLLQFVTYLVVDGYYSKLKFVEAVLELGLQQIGKLRHDANLRYLYHGPQKKFGARRKYDGKVKFDDLRRLTYVDQVEPDIHLYTAVVYNVNLNRNIRLVYLLNLKNKNKPGYALLFSTDTELDPERLYRYYKARFQIEFVFRDAKQFTGLTDCQARQQASLDFHFNAALTTLNLAKVDAYLSFGYDADTPFSLATQKMVYFNQHFLEKVLTILVLDPSLINCQPALAALRTYGAIDLPPDS
ncbi:MAG: transposase [Anaerolineae bacterium]|nr:transposase [Anaerolineae bacterium]